MNNMYLTLASQNEDEGVNNLLYYRPMNRSVNPLNCGEFALLWYAYDHDIVDSNIINIQTYVLLIFKLFYF